MLQLKAGYIRCKTASRQLDEVLLQRTAGPYIRVKRYRPIEPIAPPVVGCCSKTGHGFASLRNVAKGHEPKSGTASLPPGLRTQPELMLVSFRLSTYYVPVNFNPVVTKPIGPSDVTHALDFPSQ